MKNNRISIQLVGGLGNQLFQIASAYGLSLLQCKQLQVKPNKHNPHSGLNYFSSIFRKIEKTELSYIKVIEPPNCFTNKLEIPNYNYNIEICGFFQNEKYFNRYKTEIYNLFSIEKWRQKYLLDKYTGLHNGCFIHFRKGDYVGNPTYDIVTDKYYELALKKIETIHQSSDILYFIFSNNLEYCRNLYFLQNKNVIYIDEDEINSLFLMSYCNIGGIGCNSTFSWWGGYLNQNENKTVIYPKKWYANNNNIDIWFEKSIVIDF